MSTGERTDPFRSFNFIVDLGDAAAAGFSECNGLSSDGDAADYREGTDFAQTVRKLPGLRKYSNVTLKRGMTQNDALFNWYRNIVNGIPDRRNVTITLMNEERTEVIAWTLENAFVNKYEANSFNASSNDVAVETIELVHEGLTMEIV